MEVKDEVPADVGTGEYPRVRVAEGATRTVVGVCTRAVGVRIVGVRIVGVRSVGVRIVGVRIVGVRSVGVRIVGVRTVGVRFNVDVRMRVWDETVVEVGRRGVSVGVPLKDVLSGFRDGVGDLKGGVGVGRMPHEERHPVANVPEKSQGFWRV
eukprot:CAMPEP_0184665750 /NCGR_PEP_ID=MMETSP0308-20130426/58447_1 /TAXON_ID=38269 /ORGANISM="Gloeochaete witrockiana, Strain SAG 46.84" /LENGTH=152 /DNA_ID=CAMNT_0027109927 /DNA_START=731 /DNA_END=1189 /DNA_ORIENTATION=+